VCQNIRKYKGGIIYECDSYLPVPTEVRVNLRGISNNPKEDAKILSSFANFKQQDSVVLQPFSAVCVAPKDCPYDIIMLAKMIDILSKCVKSSDPHSHSHSGHFPQGFDSKLQPLGPDSFINVFISPKADIARWIQAGGILVGHVINGPKAQYVDLEDFSANCIIDAGSKMFQFQVEKLLALASIYPSPSMSKLVTYGF
jgi:hypothetical protein